MDYKRNFAFTSRKFFNQQFMKIFVKAKPRSKAEKVEKISETDFVVSVKEPPIKGKANEAICRVLAKYFKVRLAQVIIKTGHTSRNKIIEIL